MSVHDAEPGDIYIDAAGKLWRCTSICSEPTAGFEEVEGYVPAVTGLVGGNTMATMVQAYVPPIPTIIRTRQSGGVNGAMWKGWKRIWRREQIAS